MFCGFIWTGLSVPNKKPSPTEFIKLVSNPRIMEAAKKFHQECANAGIHITKEVESFHLLAMMLGLTWVALQNAFELLSGRPKDL